MDDLYYILAERLQEETLSVYSSDKRWGNTWEQQEGVEVYHRFSPLPSDNLSKLPALLCGLEAIPNGHGAVNFDRLVNCQECIEMAHA